MFKHKEFSCKLKARQCAAETQKGERCKRRTRKQLPYCYEHTRIILHVEIRPSTIEGAGLGLFAVEDFKKDDLIVPYEGEFIDEEELNRRYGDDTAKYALQINKDLYIDSACSRGTGAFINQAQTKAKNNARLSKFPGRRTIAPHASVRAIKSIKAGDEIFVDYGDEYIMD